MYVEGEYTFDSMIGNFINEKMNIGNLKKHLYYLRGPRRLFVYHVHV